VAVLSPDEFDAIEFDAACTGDHAAAARRMTELASQGVETAGMPRAEAFLRAGEQWLLADDPAAAASGFRRALADGGPVFVDPRVPLARALFQLGEAGEAQRLISRLHEEGPTDPRVCDLVAELLVDREDLAGALDWATAGVELCLRQAAPPGRPGPADQDASRPPGTQLGSRPARRPVPGQAAEADVSELRLLLHLRYRIRNDLGLPEDSYDALLDEA
jgi:hypothetical protein